MEQNYKYENTREEIKAIAHGCNEGPHGLTRVAASSSLRDLLPSAHCAHNKSCKSEIIRRKSISAHMPELWISPCRKALPHQLKLNMALSETNHKKCMYFRFYF